MAAASAALSFLIMMIKHRTVCVLYHHLVETPPPKNKNKNKNLLYAACVCMHTGACCSTVHVGPEGGILDCDMFAWHLTRSLSHTKVLKSCWHLNHGGSHDAVRLKSRGLLWIPAAHPKCMKTNNLFKVFTLINT